MEITSKPYLSLFQDGNSFVAMLQGAYPAQRPTITLAELEQLQFASEMMVTVPQEILEVLRDIRDALRLEGIRPSDRRFRQVLSLLKASATLDGRDVVIRKDLIILVHSLWVTPEANERDIVRRTVQDRVLDPIQKEIADLTDIIRDLARSVDSSDLSDTKVVLELSQKIKSLKMQVENIPNGNAYPEVGKLLNILDEKRKSVATAALGV